MPAGQLLRHRGGLPEAGAWSDPELLERLKTQAKHFTLGGGRLENAGFEVGSEVHELNVDPGQFSDPCSSISDRRSSARQAKPLIGRRPLTSRRRRRSGTGPWRRA